MVKGKTMDSFTTYANTPSIHKCTHTQTKGLHKYKKPLEINKVKAN